MTDVPAYGGISGVEDTAATMFLVGVFLGPSGQPAAPPPTLNVTNANNIASFSPVIGQQFFIGDGRTSTQALQTFLVPTGATALFLGFAEDFGFSNPDELPGYYSDNGGTLTVNVEPDTALPTATALTASTASAAPRQPVSFTATVSDLFPGGATPNGGTVTFSDQGGTIGSETLVNGVAELTTTSLAAGTDTVTASYGGATGFAPSATGTIVTAVGNGMAGYSGDNGPATAAELDAPWGLAVRLGGRRVHRRPGKQRGPGGGEVDRRHHHCRRKRHRRLQRGQRARHRRRAVRPDGLAVDAAGDVFISDSGNAVIREVVKASGNIITFAGNGKAGYSGDNGPATAAELNSPRGIGIDTAGDLFIADALNNVIREVVKSSGDIITVAGNGTAGYSGDNGPAIAAELNEPLGVAVDAAGDLFIADGAECVVREVVKSSGDIVTFAGNGTAGYSGDGGPATAAELDGPLGVAVNAAGDLFIADYANDVVREVVKSSGDIITVAGNGTAGYSGDNGPATAAELNVPGRVAVDAAGDLFIADASNNAVREVTPAVIVTVGQSAPADQFVVTTSFANPDVAGTAGTVTVIAEDPYGNIAGSGPNQYLGTVDVSSTDPQIAGLPATYRFTTGDDGSHTFNVTLMTAGPQTITATDSVTSTITGTSPTIHVSAGHAVSLAIVKRPPGGIPAGSRFTVGVGAEDPYGNVDPTFNGPVTVGLASGSAGSLGGTLTQTAVDGVATFDDLVNTTSGSITLTGTSGTLTTGSSGNNTVPIDPAAVDHFTVTTSFATPDVAGTAGTVTVAAYDQYGNLENSDTNPYEGTVDLASTDGQSTGLPASYTFASGDAGTYTFDGVVLDTAGSQSITATDSADSTITGTSLDVEVIPAAASQMLIISGPLTLAAGNRGAVLLQFEDAYGNAGATSTVVQTIDLATTSSDGAFYGSSSGGTPTTSISVPAGHSSATFYYTDTLEGTPTVTASALGSAPSQQETINPVAASQVLITSSPLTLAAGSRGPVVVQFEDAYGNLGATSTSDQTIGLGTTSPAGAFYAGATGGGAIASGPITAGLDSATFYYSDTQPGSPTVTVSDTALSSSVNQGETIVPAAADHFVVTTSFATPDVAGTVGTVTVTAKDHYGNTAGSGPNPYEGTVELTSTDGLASGLPASYPFTTLDAGSHTFTNVVLETAGKQTVTATDSVTSMIDGGATVAVVPAAASQVAIAGAPLTLVAGSTGEVTVQLEDAYGNPLAVSASDQTIGLATTGGAGAFYASQGGITRITSVVIPAGTSTVTFAYGDTQAGTPTVTASDPALGSAPTQNETVVPAAADHFTVTTSFTSPDVAGTGGVVTITAYDAYNNRVGSGPNDYADTVELTSTDGQIAGLLAKYTFTPLDAGSHTFTNVVLKTAGNQSITATDSVSGTITGHTTVTVTAAAATHLVFTTPPPDPITPGQTFTVVVAAEDPFGNVDTSFDGGVTITLPGQPATIVTGQATDGVATFANLTLDATSQGGSIQVGGGGLTTGSTGPVSVNSGSTSQGGGSNGPGNGSSPTPPTPTITGEQVVMFQKKNKKGKPVGKAVLQGFTLDFSTAMNAATAGSTGNYQMTATSTKHAKKKTIPPPTPVAFTAAYNAATNSVTLTLAGKQAFAKGGQITVIYSAVTSEGGTTLDPGDATFTITPKGKGITPG